VPDLLALFSRHDNETLQSVSTTLGLFGAAAFDALLGIVRDPSRTTFQRAEAITGALLAASGTPELRGRVAAALREVLADYVARAADLTDEESEMASFIVADLSQLADPQARETIDAAFQADIVDRFIIRPEDVEENYRREREEIPRPEPRAWLEEYKELYQEELQAREDQARRPPGVEAEDEDWEDEDWEDEEWEEDAGGGAEPPPAGPPKPLPFERSGPRIGRNDPCWCGSGKKYKNCHLARDRENG
jgi:preprotein translocase subunit SecA